MAFLGKDNVKNAGQVLDIVSNSLSQLVPARVKDIDQSATLNNGTITVEIIGVSGNLANSNVVTAIPIFPNIKNYPLINEVVFLISNPTGEYANNPGKIKYYYLSPLNLWQNPQVNPTPAQYSTINSKTQQKSNDEILAGSPNISSKNQTETFKPGTYFTERSNIFPLYPFEGDVIFEGRFGNSIRFGSTDITHRSKTTEKIIDRKFFGRAEYPSGGTDTNSIFYNKLTVINNQVGQFFAQYSNDKISIFIESSESQVTNPEGIKSGDLAKLRAEKVRSLLSSFPNLVNNINVSTKIGETSYTVGTDNPLDPKYLLDQYTTVTILVQGSEITNEPSQPSPLNNWSTTGSNGDPITIIRNGQSLELTGSAQSLITEDINKDQSSIWMTSTQNIPLEVSSTNEYLSYPSPENKPTAVNQYAGKQILVNSGRLVLNSNEDHLMLSSVKSINLNAQESINFDTTGDTIFQSNQVYLGGTENSQPLVLGDDLKSLLTDVLNDLDALYTKISTQTGVPSGAPLVPLSTNALILKSKITAYKTRLNNSLSKTSKST